MSDHSEREILEVRFAAEKSSVEAIVPYFPGDDNSSRRLIVDVARGLR
jgi:hypothetical protein